MAEHKVVYELGPYGTELRVRDVLHVIERTNWPTPLAVVGTYDEFGNYNYEAVELGRYETDPLYILDIAIGQAESRLVKLRAERERYEKKVKNG